MKTISFYSVNLMSALILTGLFAGCSKDEKQNISVSGWPPGVQGTIVFSDLYYWSGFDIGDIFTFDVNGKKFIHHSGHGSIHGVKWSPDKNRIGYTEGGKVYTMANDGNDTVLIRADGNYYGWLDWSPDGNRIVLSTGYEGYFGLGSGQIYIMNADGTGLFYVTEGVVPAWAPDGTRIIFFRTGSDSGIWSYDFIAQSATKLADFHISTRGAISPDGTRVLFRGYPPDDAIIMNLDGTSKIQLTLGDPDYSGEFAVIFSPCWSPDGTRIAYWWRPDYMTGNESYLCIINADGSNRVIVAKTHTAQNSDWK